MSRDGDRIASALDNIRGWLMLTFIRQNTRNEEYQEVLKADMAKIERSLRSMRDSGEGDAPVELERIKRATIGESAQFFREHWQESMEWGRDTPITSSGLSDVYNAYVEFVNSIDLWNLKMSPILKGLSATICDQVGRCSCKCIYCIMDRAAGGQEHPGAMHCKSHREGCHVRCSAPVR